MQSEVSYIPYATSSHEQTGDIITFAHFEEGGLVENKCNAEEGKSFLASIDESSTYYESDDLSISTNTLKDIWDRIQIHPELNARDARFKIHDCIK